MNIKILLSIVIAFIIMVVISVVIVPRSEGTDWVCLSSDKEISIYYDKESIIHISRNIIRVWEKWEWSGEGEVDGFKFTAIFFIEEINCHLKETRTLKALYRLKNGWYHETEDLYGVYPTKWRSMVPGTQGEFELNTICQD